MKLNITSVTKHIDVLPMVKHYISELGLYELFKRYIPKKPNAFMEPAQTLCMMIVNIICAPRPLYKVEDWLADYTDGMAEEGINASQYNDDRLGRDLDKLYNADRHSMMTEVSSNAIVVYSLETDDVHNDSTSVTFTGEYEDQPPETVNLARGFNKDHRPDCKQLVFGLNITADGNVPLSFHLYDGNQTDDKTHIPNWEGLRELLEKEDFTYIADCKLCSLENLDHIHANGGTFITIMPKNRKEVKDFHEHIQTNDVDWDETILMENSRKKGEFITYKIFEQAATTEEYRLIWVHSSAKEHQDKGRRDAAIKKALAELDAISKKLNKYKLKTEKQIEAAIKKACKGRRDLFNIELVQEKKVVRTQSTPGRPGPKTVYKEEEITSFSLEYAIDQDAVSKAARTDGLFPLITNSLISGADVLRKYKNQPYLEKRMYTAKSVLKVAPVFLESPKRIEAMLFLYFIALMIVGLIERNIRKNMRQEHIEKLPILPNNQKTKTPTWNNLNYFFRNVHLSIISQDENILSSSVKGLSAMHNKVLKLLEVPVSVYKNIKDQWWLFEPV
jgi:transposase